MKVYFLDLLSTVGESFTDELFDRYKTSMNLHGGCNCKSKGRLTQLAIGGNMHVHAV